MFGIVALDVVIGLIFVFLLFSLFVTIINEMLSQIFKIRGKELRFSIERMIGFKLKQIFYDKPKINKSKYRSSVFYGTPFWNIYVWFRKTFSSSINLEAEKLEEKLTSKTYPSSISPATFSETIIEMIEDKQLREDLFEHAPFLKKAYDDSSGQLEAFRQELEDWFDEVMVYTSEWYKQKLRLILLGLGLLTAGIFNVDSISIFQTLANDPDARTAVVQQAETFIESHNLQEGMVVAIPSGDTTETDTLRSSYLVHEFLQAQREPCGQNQECIDSVNTAYPTMARIDYAYQQINNLVEEDIDRVSTVLGMGWSNLPDKRGLAFWWDWILRVLGWLITALAISLGAPFWFDMLSKVVNLKNVITRKTSDEPKSIESKKNDGASG
ncbi:MAG: hypothetical protein U5K69_29750 [Balneolaceae bacterium]|nr:hypothetical protein [Balneolaceae bacterium]